MKKLALLVGAFAFLFIGAGTASAEWTVNDDSTLNYFRSHFSRFQLSNSNTANITNNVSSTSNTGGNVIRAEEDVEDGSIRTGDADSASTVENVANDIDTEVDASYEMDSSFENEDVTVDDDSDANVTVETEDRVNQDNENRVTVTNNVDATSRSGGNEVRSDNDDVEGGSIDTGNADSASEIANAFNILRSRITRN